MSTRSGHITLVASAVALEAVLLALLRWPQAGLLWFYAAAALYLIALAVVVRGGGGRTRLRFILLAAVVFRLTLLPMLPQRSNELYRTHWDGEVQHAGFNPYQYAPANDLFNPIRVANDQLVPAPALAAYRLPFAELLARWSFNLSPRVRLEKILFVVFDILLLLLLVRMLRARQWPQERVLIYAWSPLAIVEIAGNGHIEAAAALLLLLAVHWAARRPRLSAAALALAALTQWFAWVAAPAVLAAGRRKWLGRAAAMALCFVVVMLPYAFMNKHFALRVIVANVRAHWSLLAPFNASLFALVANWFGRRAAEIVAAGVLIVVIAKSMVRKFEPARAALVAIAALLLVAPQVQPWYVLWLLPLLALWPERGWIYFSLAVPLAYLAPSHGWVVWVEYVPLFALMAWESLVWKKEINSQ